MQLNTMALGVVCGRVLLALFDAERGFFMHMSSWVWMAFPVNLSIPQPCLHLDIAKAPTASAGNVVDGGCTPSKWFFNDIFVLNGGLSCLHPATTHWYLGLFGSV